MLQIFHSMLFFSHSHTHMSIAFIFFCVIFIVVWLKVYISEMILAKTCFLVFYSISFGSIKQLNLLAIDISGRVLFFSSLIYVLYLVSFSISECKCNANASACQCDFLEFANMSTNKWFLLSPVFLRTFLPFYSSYGYDFIVNRIERAAIVPSRQQIENEELHFIRQLSESD